MAGPHAPPPLIPPSLQSDLAEDYVMMRRLALTRGDPIRNMHLPEKVRLDEGREGSAVSLGL